MRIVLSRKGFDSQYGGVPSPILPNGEILSFPIPSHDDPHRIGDLWPMDPRFNQLVADLTGNRITTDSRVHLDPDLDPAATRRPPGWRPSFGQIGAAQTHLVNQGVGPGDLFLFFGWFRQVEKSGERWRYVRGSPDLHLVFGYLQVESVVPVPRAPTSTVRQYPWLASHPHVARAAQYSGGNNTIYIGCERLDLGGVRTSLPGAASFARFGRQRQLTSPGRTRSVWQLPRWFLPTEGGASLSYHENPARWSVDGNGVQLQTVGKGQEFVLDTTRCPEAVGWAADLLGA
jgi:hypothetical protein